MLQSGRHRTRSAVAEAPQTVPKPSQGFLTLPAHGSFCHRAPSGTDRSQLLLLPEAVDDYVGPDNPVRFIEAFVDGLDLQVAGFERAGGGAREGLSSQQARLARRNDGPGALRCRRRLARAEIEDKRPRSDGDASTIDHPQRSRTVCRRFATQRDYAPLALSGQNSHRMRLRPEVDGTISYINEHCGHVHKADTDRETGNSCRREQRTGATARSTHEVSTDLDDHLQDCAGADRER
mgnify:CR=1 FL=1